LLLLIGVEAAAPHQIVAVRSLLRIGAA
jgi:hypothetical protein